MNSEAASRSPSLFCYQTLDDLMHAVISALLLSGIKTSPTRGPAQELTGVLLELENPRARLSRTEARGRVFSCLGELCWYLAKSDDVEFVSYYIGRYRKEAEGRVIHGAYGPRLFGPEWPDQVENVVALLAQNPWSRRAVIQLFDANDLHGAHKDVPCTCSIQFLVRGDALNAVTMMRSNDAYVGLPHDVFCFTMLQEIVARRLGIDVGFYKHAVGSLHLYETDREDAEAFINEGWQSTGKAVMPVMPPGDPRSSIETLLRVEVMLREGKRLDPVTIEGLEPYWADLVRLLQVYAASRSKDPKSMVDIRQSMSSPVFDAFIEAKLAGLADRVEG